MTSCSVLQSRFVLILTFALVSTTYEKQPRCHDKEVLRGQEPSTWAAYGAAIDHDKVVEYAMGEFWRLAALRAEPGARSQRDHRRARRGRAAGNDLVARQDDASQQSWRGQAHDHSSQPAGGGRLPAGQAA